MVNKMLLTLYTSPPSPCCLQGNYSQKKSNPKPRNSYANPTLTKHMLLNYAAFEIEFQPALTHFRAATQVEVRVGVGCRAAGEGEERKEKEGQGSPIGKAKRSSAVKSDKLLFMLSFLLVLRIRNVRYVYAPSSILSFSLSRWVIPLVNLTAIKFAYISIKCRTLKSFARQANKAKCGV